MLLKVQLSPEMAFLLFGHHEQESIGCFSSPCEDTMKIYGKLQCFQSSVMDFNAFFIDISNNVSRSTQNSKAKSALG